ncbi:hypothetical protein Hanom_Chr11g01025621 [Helianthus anomalus]
MASSSAMDELVLQNSANVAGLIQRLRDSWMAQWKNLFPQKRRNCSLMDVVGDKVGDPLQEVAIRGI